MTANDNLPVSTASATLHDELVELLRLLRAAKSREEAEAIAMLAIPRTEVLVGRGDLVEGLALDLRDELQKWAGGRDDCRSA
jgi:hypothetical protein